MLSVAKRMRLCSLQVFYQVNWRAWTFNSNGGVIDTKDKILGGRTRSSVYVRRGTSFNLSSYESVATILTTSCLFLNSSLDLTVYVNSGRSGYSLC